MDSGLEQGSTSRESSGNDNTGPSCRPPPLPSSEQPDVVQTSVAVANVAVNNTGRSNWILPRKWKYSICCLRDVRLKLERDLSNSIYNT